MNNIARNLSDMQEGVDTASFIDSLQYLSDQIRQLDQTLTIKVEERIGSDYNVQHQNLKYRQVLQKE